MPPYLLKKMSVAYGNPVQGRMSVCDSTLKRTITEQLNNGKPLKTNPRMN